jgi:hypothetical protein
VSLGDGVSLTITNRSATDVKLAAHVADDAQLGMRSLTVEGPNGTVTLRDAFEVQIGVLEVLDIEPEVGLRGTTVSLAITGKSLDLVDTVRFDPSTGVQAGTPTNQQPNRVNVSITIEGTAPEGSRRVIVSGLNGSDEGTFWIFTSRDVAVRGITPNRAQRDDHFTLTVSGQNLDTAGHVSLGDGVTLTITGRRVDELTFDAHVEADARLGMRDLVVVGPNNTVTLANAFEVQLGVPEVLEITPEVGLRGTTIPVAVVGRSLEFVDTVTFDPSTGVQVGIPTFQPPNRVEVSVTIASTAPEGSRRLIVSGPNGSDEGTFWIFDSRDVAVTGVTPNRAQRDDRFTLTVSGQNLDQAGHLSLGDGVTLTTTGRSINQLTADAYVEPDAPLGMRDLEVVGPNNTVTLANAFEVQIGVLQVLDIRPGSAEQGNTVRLTIAARSLDLVDKVELAPPHGVRVGTPTNQQPNQVEVSITIADDALIGDRRVIVSGPNGSDEGTFRIEEPPPEGCFGGRSSMHPLLLLLLIGLLSPRLHRNRS